MPAKNGCHSTSRTRSWMENDLRKVTIKAVCEIDGIFDDGVDSMGATIESVDILDYQIADSR